MKGRLKFQFIYNYFLHYFVLYELETSVCVKPNLRTEMESGRLIYWNPSTEP